MYFKSETVRLFIFLQAIISRSEKINNDTTHFVHSHICTSKFQWVATAIGHRITDKIKQQWRGFDDEPTIVKTYFDWIDSIRTGKRTMILLSVYMCMWAYDEITSFNRNFSVFIDSDRFSLQKGPMSCEWSLVTCCNLLRHIEGRRIQSYTRIWMCTEFRANSSIIFYTYKIW